MYADMDEWVDEIRKRVLIGGESKRAGLRLRRRLKQRINPLMQRLLSFKFRTVDEKQTSQNYGKYDGWFHNYL